MNKSLYFILLIHFVFVCIAQDFSSSSSFSSTSGDFGSNRPTSSNSSDFGIVVGENYILKPSDVIQVTVYQEPDLDKTNPKSITIKRVSANGKTQQFEVNFNRILMDADSKDIILEEGDTVWVPERLI